MPEPTPAELKIAEAQRVAAEAAAAAQVIKDREDAEAAEKLAVYTKAKAEWDALPRNQVMAAIKLLSTPDIGEDGYHALRQAVAILAQLVLVGTPDVPPAPVLEPVKPEPHAAHERETRHGRR